jgi:hypothetical protein
VITDRGLRLARAFLNCEIKQDAAKKKGRQKGASAGQIIAKKILQVLTFETLAAWGPLGP